MSKRGILVFGAVSRRVLRRILRTTLPGALCAASFAQAPTAPVVSPRGVINAITQQPAPSRVGPGGIIWINGLNLGPADGAKAVSAPLPMRLAEPAIEVQINGRAAPLFSVSPGRIVAQVPWETTAGLATVVVKRGDQTSKAAKIFVDNLRPAIRTTDDKGFGSAATSASGTSVTLSATGLGPTDKRVASGDAGPEDGAAPRANVYGWIGGSPANAVATLSTTRVGEFDIKVDVPADAQAGDMIAVVVNTTATRAVYQKGSTVEMKYIKMPTGAPDFRALATSDLRPGFIALSAARDPKGCYPSYVFDFGRQTGTAVDGCLTAAPNAQSPFTAAQEGAALAAFVGPPPSDPQAPISGNVRVFNPGSTEPMNVTLPEPAAILLSSEGGNFGALIPSNPPRLVTMDSITGEVKEGAAGGIGIPGGGGGGGGLNLLNLSVDLGDGIKEALTIPTNLGQGNLGLVVGNDVDKPTKAKWAIVNAQGQVQSTKDFPANYLPLVAPAAPVAAGGGGFPGGIPGFPGGPGGVNPLARFRTPTYVDQANRLIFVVSTKADGSRHALTAIPMAVGNARAIEMPDGWFVAACTNVIDVNPIELANRLVLYGSRTLDNTYKLACPANGYLVVDLDGNTVQAIELPGSGQFNASGASAAAVNDYVYGSNTDPQRRGVADTLYVLDGVTASAFRLDLPSEIASFANLQPVPSMGILIGLAAKTNPGDAGIVIFDLETASSKLLPTPAGFGAVQLMAVFANQRKIVAKGTKSDNSGSQFLIYDLLSGDLVIVDNPTGVAWVGQAPQVQGQPGQGGGGVAAVPALQRVNAKAAVIEAVTYDAQRRQTGVMTVRVP